MKKHSYKLLYGILVLTVAVPSIAAMDQQPSWQDKILSKEGIVTLAGLGGAGYLAYNNDTVRTTASDYCNKASEYAQNNPGTVGFGATAACLSLYYGYKWLTTKTENPLLVSAHDVLPLYDRIENADSPKRSQPAEHSTDTQGIAEWLENLFVLLDDVYAGFDMHDKKDVLNRLVHIAVHDPHDLVVEQDLMRRLSNNQKIFLLSILDGYCIDRITKVVKVLINSLNDDQVTVKEILDDLLKAGDFEQLKGALAMYAESKDVLTSAQATFVQSEIEYLGTCEVIESSFAKLHKLDKAVV